MIVFSIMTTQLYCAPPERSGGGHCSPFAQNWEEDDGMACGDAVAECAQPPRRLGPREADRCRGGGGRPPDPPSLCAAAGRSQGRLRARSAPSRICDSGSDAGLYRGINRSRGGKPSPSHVKQSRSAVATPFDLSRRRVCTAGVATDHCGRRPRGGHGNVPLAAPRQWRSQRRPPPVAVLALK